MINVIKGWVYFLKVFKGFKYLRFLVKIMVDIKDDYYFEDKG